MTDVVVELPALRPGAAPVRLAIEGPGVEVVATRQVGARGRDTLWSARLRVDAPPGDLLLVLRPVYSDGASVELEQVLTVVPAAEGSSFPWLVAAGVLVALAAAAGALAVARRSA